MSSTLEQEFKQRFGEGVGFSTMNLVRPALEAAFNFVCGGRALRQDDVLFIRGVLDVYEQSLRLVGAWVER